MAKSLVVRVETTDYEFSHGHTPKGRGGWLFSFVRNPDVINDVLINCNGTYTEAKKALKVELDRRGYLGHVTMYACP